ncbi:MAG: L,D-transpeptidase family protein [Boseongicola sp.]|nr:L,D-transpeptidase family protein [Boseongicola sp.]MDD9976864.1 L,D-transpeptidase family protein [Boseongicola sp.]
MHALRRLSLLGVFVCLVSTISLVVPAQAQVTAFMQAVAEAAAKDKDIAAFYKANGYKPIWTGKTNRDKQRRSAFLKAIGSAGVHGLPAARYEPEKLKTNLRSVRSERDLGRLEVELSRLFLLYARDIQTGILTPRRVDSGLVREVPLRSRTSILTAFAKSSPSGFIKSLPPKDPEYARLMKEKMRFEKLIGKGGWGQAVKASSLKPGASGKAVVQLRNRLIAMGYLKRTSTQSYDEKMKQAVALFQRDHGLFTDGVAGKGTMAAINISPEVRLTQIMVAMERERWINMNRGKRHIWVNLTDFHARIVDNGKITFETRSVIGANQQDRRSPEFSDVMEHMVINPTWNVPRSIATKEYLPMLQKDPYAIRHMNLINTRGQIVSREGMDFTQFDEKNFPFDLKEPPSRGNALGLVKFMFPNRHNIYLHDTPAKSLFGRERRAFSHGCIRLNDPFDFAYTLLAKQTRDPQTFFQQRLATGRETVVELEQHVPVHLVYRTAFTKPKGKIQFRGDVYGRDAKIWRALQNAGVALRSVRG